MKNSRGNFNLAHFFLLAKFGYRYAGTGVYTALPRQNCGFVYRCSIDMGNATKSWELIDDVLKDFANTWRGEEYR